MKKSRTKLFAALHQLHQERRRLVHRLKREREFAIGTVSVVNRKCGNPNCRCVEGPGHPQTLFLFKDEKTGRRKCKLVRRADEVRDDMKKLRAIDLEEKRILMALAEERAIHYE
jgi:hypothetical protein